MNLFLAPTQIELSQQALRTGLFSRIVTNPDCIAGFQKKPMEVMQDLVSLGVSTAYYMIREDSVDAMKSEVEGLLEIDKVKVGVKIALTPNGMEVVEWLRHEQPDAEIMATCIATPSHVCLASALGVRWITPWGSLQQKSGGPGRDQVIKDMQNCLTGIKSNTQLVVGITSGPELAALAMMGINSAFVWDKDVPNLIESPWTRKALATFETAWAKLDDATGTGDTANRESSY